MPNKSQTKQSIARGQGDIETKHGGGSRNEWGAPAGSKRRDPATRKTGKPDVKMEHATETAILRTCADVCNETLLYCLEQGHTDPQHIVKLIDAFEICTLTAHFVSRDSAYAEQLQSLCAGVVKACEESCEEFEDDDRMVACADVCRECCEHLGLPTEGQ